MVRPVGPNQLADGGGYTEPDVSGVGLDAETAALLSLVVALKDIDDNLKLAYEEYLKPTKNMAKFIALVKASKFFQDYSKSARDRAILKTEQRGVWDQQLEKYLTEQKKRLATAGIKWNTDVEQQVKNAFDLALDDDVLDKLIIATGKFGAIGGAAAATIEELQEYANSFGVKALYDQKYWDSQRQAMFLGTADANEIQADIRQKAIEAYPAWAKGFAEGKSLDVQAGWIKSLVAQQVGMDPNSLTFDDPMVAPFLSYKDPKSGQQVIPSLLDVRTETRRKYFDQFAKTAEGTSYLDGLTVKVLQDMGLM